MTLACCFVLYLRHPLSPRMGSQFLNGFGLVPSQTGGGLSYPTGLGCQRHPRSPRMGSQFLNGFGLVPFQTGVGLSYPPWLGSIYFLLFPFSVYNIFPSVFVLPY
ncbi:hypothetical protein CXB51_029210 [Gossypium anomalum]|uniref:Uncharacterized protein n=1 Tax=Gossypium anomalum TaxID=47600 RepID=A0A8J5YNJ9_9ROSI|nr:hypothetical protein CXB51_029210 [Gossypium anomalum]